MLQDPTATTPPEGYARIGVLGRPFQLEGGLRLTPAQGSTVEALERLEEVFVVGVGRVAVRRTRRHGEGVLLYLQGVHDREAAGRLTGTAVYAAATAGGRAPNAAAATLVGQEVRLGVTLVGHVRALRGTEANPLLLVATPRGETLLPLNAPYVVLRSDGVALVDPPTGLLEPP